MFKSKKAIISLLLFFVLILVNSGIVLFLSGALRLDISAKKIYSLSSATEKLLKNLDTEITLYVLNADSADKTLKFLYESYADFSDKITLKYCYAADFEDYLLELGFGNLTDVSAYSLIIESEYRRTFLYSGSFECFYFNSEYYETYDFYEMLYYYSQYYPDYVDSIIEETENCFRGEQLLSAQIEYVSQILIPHPYLITGHGGNLVWDGDFAEYMLYYGTESLNLSEKGSIPDDAYALIIAYPESDLSETEYNLILAFLKAGGGLTVFTNEANHAHTRLMAILDEYGLSPEEGILGIDVEVEPEESEENEDWSQTEAEEDSDNEETGDDEEETEDEAQVITEKSTEITIELNIDNEMFAGVNDIQHYTINNANAIRLNKDKRPDDLFLNAVLSTSEDCYLGDYSDEKAVFCTAASAEEPIDGGIKTTRVVWFTGADYILGSDVGDLAVIPAFALNWMTETYKSVVSSLTPKIIDTTGIEVSNADVIIIAVVFIGILPLGIIFIGYTINQKRKNA